MNVKASHEILYPEHLNIYHFGKLKQIDVEFECLNDGAKSRYSHMYNINGYKYGTKIHKAFNSNKYWILGPSLNLDVEFINNKIIKSKQVGYDSNGNEITAIFEVLETDSDHRPIKAKSYENTKKTPVDGKTKKEKSNVIEKDDVLDYSFENSIVFREGLNNDERSDAVAGSEFEFTTYEFIREYKEVVKTIHEYTYYNNLYVQKDIPIESAADNKEKDNAMKVHEVAVEISSGGQKLSEMFKGNSDGNIIIKKENTYDKNNRLIYEKNIDGKNYRYQYYINGLLERVTQEAFLQTINYSLKYDYPVIDKCGNPIIQNIQYVVPSIRDENRQIPSFCPSMRRSFTYKYYAPC